MPKRQFTRLNKGAKSVTGNGCPVAEMNPISVSSSRVFPGSLSHSPTLSPEYSPIDDFLTNSNNSSCRSGVSSYSLVPYSQPRLHTGKSWYVDFFCFDPVAGEMRRKKYCLNNIKKLSDRRQRAAELITTISARLREGWNVWADLQGDSNRMYTLYSEVCRYYLLSIDKLQRAGVMKPSTLTRYQSYLKKWNEWLSGVSVQKVMYVYQLRDGLIRDFLDYLFLDLDSSACTRNNYLTWLGTFCEWLVEKRYMEKNPCTTIKKLKEDAKKRESLSPTMLRRLRTELNETDRYFLLACMMEYYTFIRPNELTHLKVQDISIKNQLIRVHASFTKNGKEAVVGLNKVLLKLMIDLKVLEAPGDFYLFGTRNFRPGNTRLSASAFRNRWAKLRKKMGWDDCYQFYSLKDTGLRDLANAVGVVVARDQARHADISTTNKYLKGDSLTVHEETKDFVGGL